VNPSHVITKQSIHICLLQVKRMLLELVTQLAKRPSSSGSSTISPADAAVQLLCRFYGPGLSLGDIRQARLHSLARLPLLTSSGEVSRKALLLQGSVMELLAARVAEWASGGALRADAVLQLFDGALVGHMKVRKPIKHCMIKMDAVARSFVIVKGAMQVEAQAPCEVDCVPSALSPPPCHLSGTVLTGQ
jgi:hypothetical protein